MFTINGLLAFVSTLGCSYILLNLFHKEWFKKISFYFVYIIIVIVLGVIMIKTKLPLNIFEEISLGLLMGLYLVAVKKTK